MPQNKKYLFPQSSLAVVVTTILVVSLLSGCGQEKEPISSSNSKYKSAGNEDGADETVADSDSNSDAPPVKPPPVSGDALSDLQVPDGTPEELLAFIQKLDASSSPPQSNADVAKVEKITSAKLEAAEKMLAVENLKQELRTQAIKAKFTALNQRVGLGHKEAEEELILLAKQMATEKDPEVAMQGKLVLYSIQVMKLSMEEDGDAGPILEDLKNILAVKKGGVAVFMTLGRTVPMLWQSGYGEEAVEAMQLIGEAFKGDEDKEVASHAATMLDEIEAVKLQLGFRNLVENKPNSSAMLVESAKNFLKDRDGPEVFGSLSNIAINAEYSGNTNTAQKLYALIREKFAGHKNKEVAEQAAKLLASSERRLGLIGKPLEISGVLVGGEKFDWSKYQGKVVLVDFWATWCGPCIAELPNLQKNYDAFHEQGFEIVGVNLDEKAKRSDVEKFIADRKLPWATVVSDDAAAQEFKDPNAVRLGVEAIPFLALVDTDGKVVALHTRGEKLADKLAALLGSTNKPDSEKKDEKEPANKTKASVSQPPVYFVSFNAEENDDDADEDSNPYLADEDLSPADLVDFILDMQEKPKSIQGRPGFNDAVIEAAERVLSEETRDRYHIIAAEVKFETLHKMASLGDNKADKKLTQFVQQMKDDARKRIADQVAFFLVERKAIDASKLSREEIPAVLDELKEYFAKEKPTTRHLRMASSTIKAINQLDDQKDAAKKEHYGEMREKYFAEFGKIFATSSDKQLAGYGKQLVKSSTPDDGTPPSDLVGKPLMLEGTTAAGADFDWKSYRGKVVLVDFWATWCGPCRKEMPHVKQFYEKYKDKGFDVVGVSLDKDLDALAKYIEDNNIAWTNLSGEGTSDLARKYQVRGIPTMMLIDKEGRIVAVSHKLIALTVRAEKLLQPAQAKAGK